MKTFPLAIGLAASVFACGSAAAFEVAQILREERVSRGDTNVRRIQPIDDAAWIGAEGLSALGGETFDTTHEIAGSFSGEFFR